MRILFLRLKNFKGIEKGLLCRKEIAVDFTCLPPGLIAVAGPNGAGKTTILDSMHPYRIMPFRDEINLADAVDGVGEKEIVFEVDGRVYRSILTIDSKRRQQEACLYVMDAGGGWVPLADGRVSDYDKAVEEIICSPDIFFLAAFRSQKAKSFTAYRKSDLKKIFEDLIGADYIVKIGESAKARRKEVDVLIKSLESERDRLEGMLRDLPDIEDVPEELIKKARELVEEKEKELENAEKKLNDVVRRVSSAAEMIRAVEQEKQNLCRSGEQTERILIQQLRDVESRIEKCRQVLFKKEEIQRAEKELVPLKEKIIEVQAGLDAREVLTKKKLSLTEKLSSIESEAREIKVRRSQMVNRIEELNRRVSLLDKTPCSADLKKRCILLKDALNAGREVETLKKQAGELEKRLNQLREEYASVKRQVREVEEKLSGLPDVSVFSQLSEKIRKLESAVSLKETVETAERDLKGLVEKKKSLQDQINAVKRDLAEKLKAVEDRKKDLDVRLADLKAEERGMEKFIEELRVSVRDARDSYQRLNERRVQYQMVSRNREQIQKQLALVKKNLENALKERSQFALIEKGFSRNGILGLELEMAAPAVSEYANALLESMESRFRIRFETIQPKKSKKGEYKETFDVKVLDTATGDENSLVVLSGGERVWVEEALARAIAIYLAHSRASSSLKTIFSDERDGALDQEMKVRYARMKRAVLEIGGYEQEFFVSHTPEIWEMADAVLHVTERGITAEIHSGPGQGQVLDLTSRNPDFLKSAGVSASMGAGR